VPAAPGDTDSPAVPAGETGGPADPARGGSPPVPDGISGETGDPADPSAGGAARLASPGAPAPAGTSGESGVTGGVSARLGGGVESRRRYSIGGASSAAGA
jgi:hypothetical protein